MPVVPIVPAVKQASLEDGPGHLVGMVLLVDVDPIGIGRGSGGREAQLVLGGVAVVVLDLVIVLDDVKGRLALDRTAADKAGIAAVVTAVAKHFTGTLALVKRLTSIVESFVNPSLIFYIYIVILI